MNTTNRTDPWTAFDDLRAQWEVENSIASQQQQGHDELRAHAITVLMALPVLVLLGAAGHSIAATAVTAVVTVALFASIGVHVWLVEHRRPAAARAQLALRERTPSPVDLDSVAAANPADPRATR